MNDTDRPDTTRVAFCQNCGKPLSAEDARNVGSAVYCEPCLVSKVAAAERQAGTVPGAAPSSYDFSGTSSGVNYRFQGTTPPAPPPNSGEPNPGLAALLGFIPGVGAFYNGQYAKGVVHLIVFAILTTLADRNGIFGLFVAGWIFYQVIEAHHTARARRDGTPLPNPFGLNDIGERLGFGRAWPAGAPHGNPVAGTPPGAAPSGVPVDAYPGYVPPASAYAQPQPGYAGYVPPAAPTWGAPAETYGAVPPPTADIPLSPVGGFGSRVPMGALVLIGLGVLFLIGNSGLFRGFPVHRLIPFLLIGVGVWIFVRKMTEMGGGLADDGTPAYRMRLFRAARGSVWIILVGVLFLLDTFNILSWGRSWPLFIIVAGIMTFVQRTAYSSSLPPQYPYAPPVPPPPAGPEPATVAPAAIVPTHSDQEGN